MYLGFIHVIVVFFSEIFIQCPAISFTGVVLKQIGMLSSISWISFCFLILFLLSSAFLGCITTTSWSPISNETYTVLVTQVIDGDTISIILPDGNKGTLRFLGVDTPELSAESNNPFEYGNITDMDCLATYASIAKTYVADRLLDKEVLIEFDAFSGFKDHYDRWLSYVYLLNGTDINALLLGQGYARVYTKETFSKKASYLVVENAARQDKKGLWSCTDRDSYGVSISLVWYDAAGDDRTNLNDEYVCVTYTANETGDTSIDLTGYSLNDDDGNRFMFPDGLTLADGQIITIYTGQGENTYTELYWGSNTPIWNNDGDTAYIQDDKEVVVDIYQWG